MENQAYFKYIQGKPFDEKLRAFGDAVESMTRASYEASNGPEGGRDYYRKEYAGQRERAEWLFADLKREYKEAVEHENKSCKCHKGYNVDVPDGQGAESKCACAKGVCVRPDSDDNAEGRRTAQGEAEHIVG